MRHKIPKDYMSAYFHTNEIILYLISQKLTKYVLRVVLKL